MSLRQASAVRTWRKHQAAVLSFPAPHDSSGLKLIEKLVASVLKSGNILLQCWYGERARHLSTCAWYGCAYWSWCKHNCIMHMLCCCTICFYAAFTFLYQWQFSLAYSFSCLMALIAVFSCLLIWLWNRRAGGIAVTMVMACLWACRAAADSETLLTFCTQWKGPQE